MRLRTCLKRSSRAACKAALQVDWLGVGLAGLVGVGGPEVAGTVAAVPGIS